MKYRQFLFDLDDTLLDFKASEQLSFDRTLAELGLAAESAAIFPHYQRENVALWAAFEQGQVEKDWLKVERFRRAFAHHGVDADADRASTTYLDCLPQTVVLIDGAARLCEALSAIGEIGIITNGVEAVQSARIANSGLGQYLAFVATSETCGHAKPDTRFFDYAAAKFGRFDRAEAVIVGDRLDADIAGALAFGIDSCWFNPARTERTGAFVPTYEAAHLDEIVGMLSAAS